MKKLKEVVLQGIAKAANRAVEDACGSKSTCLFFEPEMPEVLKKKKELKS